MTIDTKQKTVESVKVKTLPMWHVILLDSPDHSFEYVVSLLVNVFKKEHQESCDMTIKVHTEGRVVAITCPKERAELYKEQVMSFGPDKLVPNCKNAIGCTLEPAE